MKPLAQLIKVEKARLLHQLFPKEIPLFIPYAKSVADTVLEDAEQLRPNWKEKSPLSFDDWLELAADTVTKIDRYNIKLYRNSRLFSDQLFDGLQTLFLEYCLLLYTTTNKPKDPKFKQAVILLFQ